MTHKKRIERLEQEKTSSLPLLIVSSYFNSDASEAPSIGYSCRGHVVKRESDESDDAMLDRLMVLIDQSNDDCKPVLLSVPCWVDEAFADEEYLETNDDSSKRAITPDFSVIDAIDTFI